jgi:hypothetical protein
MSCGHAWASNSKDSVCIQVSSFIMVRKGKFHMQIYSLRYRSLLALLASAIAWQPIYGQRLSPTVGAERLPVMDTKLPTVGLKPLNPRAPTDDNALPKIDRLRPEKTEKGTCKSTGFTKTDFKDFLKLDKDQKNVPAPILEDLTPCDQPLYEQCTETLVSALRNPGQALVGLDPQRDEQIELGSVPRYTEDDVREIRGVLSTWITSHQSLSQKRDPFNPTRQATVEEQELDKILDVNLPAQKGVLSSQDIGTVSDIHLKLSNELAAAAEAADAAPAYGSLQAASLLARVNPMASEGLSCLLGFKKPKAEQPVQLLKKRKIIGYASGIYYGEMQDPTRMEPVTIGTLIVAGATLVGSLVATYAYFKIEREKIALEREKMNREAAEKQKDRDHASAEAEKARDFEREKLGIPARKTEDTPIKKPALKPIEQPEKPLEEPIKKLDDKDFNAVPNGHYIEDDYNCKLDIDKTGLNKTWTPESQDDAYVKVPLPDTSKGYYDYGNPAYSINYRAAKVLSLEDFKKRKEENMRNEECEVLDYAQP